MEFRSSCHITSGSAGSPDASTLQQPVLVDVSIRRTSDDQNHILPVNVTQLRRRVAIASTDVFGMTYHTRPTDV